MEEKKQDKNVTSATNVGTTNIGTSQTNTQYGWVCPRCGKVISPWMVYCPFCSGIPNRTEYINYFDIGPKNPPTYTGDPPGWWNTTTTCAQTNSKDNQN